MRTIDVRSRFPSLKAVWMNGPLVEMRIQIAPAAPARRKRAAA